MDSKSRSNEVVTSLIASARCRSGQGRDHFSECNNYECMRLRVLTQGTALGSRIDDFASRHARHLWQLALDTAERASEAYSPFSGYLEVPRAIAEASGAWGPQVSDAVGRLQTVYRLMLRDLVLWIDPQLDSQPVSEDGLRSMGLSERPPDLGW